jgi:UMF1 family MFS transporter
MADFKINDKRVINAWALFDWANSAYALVISTAIFPAYFIAFTPDKINFLGFDLSNTSLYSYAVAFSYLVIAFLSPLLSGIADYSGKRKYFLKIFTVVGALACIALYFFNGEPKLWLGTSAFILATIGFAGGIVFYNAYLPEIVTEDRYDKVSAKGYAFGYIGSVILLIGILMMINFPDFFGIKNESLPARIGFVLVGVWWLGFSQITFKYLPKDKITSNTVNLFSKGFDEIKMVFGQLKRQGNLKKFLLSFFFYSAGVQTVIYLATIFAKEELNFAIDELIITVLILQIVAIGGAYLFAQVSKWKGNKFSLMTMLVIWIFICVVAYVIESKVQFYFIAGLVGMVMGGIQSLSRSTYSKLLEDKTKDLTSYFSFYDVLYKLSIVAGTVLFGLVNQITGNMRNSVLVLAIFFIIGMVLLSLVNLKETDTQMSKS